MARARIIVSMALGGLAVAVGCGSASSVDDGGTPGTLGSGGKSASAGASGASSTGGKAGNGVGGAGGLGTAGSGTTTCTPACDATMKCGSNGMCLAKDGCASMADCGPGTVCDLPTKKCVPGGGCGAQKIASSAIPSNLIIALDRSCSMTQKLASGKTKWEVAVAAIGQMTSQFGPQIRFGLSMFPTKTGDKCAAAGPIAVPIGDMTGPKITALLQASLVSTDPNFPSAPCTTPIDAGIKSASTDPALTDGVHASFALLMTDGEQSACTLDGGATGAEKEIAALAAKGVPTFVVGFGGQVNVMQLDAFATAGGKPASPASPKFYSAEDEPSLAKALATIAGQAIGCSFSLGSTPPDPSMLYTFFDKKDVPRDPTHMAGWDYDPAKNQVTVYGSYCAQLKTGAVKVVDIVFGCDVPPPG